MHWNIFGHNHVKRILELQIKSGIFSHTYLFLGSESLGKKSLAFDFAKEILKTEKLENHPDFVFLDESNITIERLREFMENLSLRPFLGNRKVAVINNAENLNIQSQNALLKTLEEPSMSTVVILVSAKPLLPTIMSRCQIFRFNRFSERQMSEFLADLKLAPSQESLHGAFGMPGKVISPDANFAEAENSWQEVKTLTRAEKLAGITKWSENESEDLVKMFEMFSRAEILSLKQEPKNFRNVHLLLQAAGALKKNFNKKLVLQTLFLNL
jgi:hypothetical protein